MLKRELTPQEIHVMRRVQIDMTERMNDPVFCAKVDREWRRSKPKAIDFYDLDPTDSPGSRPQSQ